LYNVLIRIGEWPSHRSTFMSSRVFQYTDDHVLQRFKPNGVIDVNAVMDLPTLFTYEQDGRDGGLPGRVGRITRMQKGARDYELSYTFDPDVPPIPQDVLSDFQAEFDIQSPEFSTTHWAIKDVNLFEVLYRHQSRSRPVPTAFNLPQVPVDRNLMSVMMPFDAGMAPVHEALKEAAQSVGMTCHRADNFWVHNHLMQDIVELISKSAVVVCDLSGRNSNVFYEMGLAHMMGKEVIMITRSADDVPFDVRHLRYVSYLPNREGLQKLSADVAARLTTLRGTR
jgi:hypothetical protein